MRATHLGSVATRGARSLPLVNQAALNASPEPHVNFTNCRRVTRCSSDWRTGKSVFQCGWLLMGQFLSFFGPRSYLINGRARRSARAEVFDFPRRRAFFSPHGGAHGVT